MHDTLNESELDAFGQIVEEVNGQRLQQLEHAIAEAHPHPPQLGAIIDAMIMPLAKQFVGTSEKHLWCMQCVRSFFTMPLEDRTAIHRAQTKEVYSAFENALQLCLPEMPGSEIRSRMFLAIGSFLGAMSRLDMVPALEEGDRPEASMWAMVHSLCDGLYGLFQAPVRMGFNESIFIDERKKNRLVSMDHIATVTANGNYTAVRFRGGGGAEVLRTLSNWKETLPPSKFIEIRRGCLVNRAAIKKTQTSPDGRLALWLEGLPEKLFCSRRQSKEMAGSLL